MSDPPKRKHDTIMARAVMLPITNFKPGTPRLDGRVERLKAMIANMETQDREVRSRMFSATFSPEALQANETRPEISTQITPEVIAALDGLRRCKEYNARAAESRQFLSDTLKKYDNSGAMHEGPATAPLPRRNSVSVAPQAPMAPMMTVSKPAEKVQSINVAPTAPMMNHSTQPAPLKSSTSSSIIDASRDPRRR